MMRAENEEGTKRGGDYMMKELHGEGDEKRLYDEEINSEGTTW